MTPFQENLVRALVSSPEDFRALRNSVENRKAFDQYLNRIWPYTISKPKTSRKSMSREMKSITKSLNEIKKFILSNGVFDDRFFSVKLSLNEKINKEDIEKLMSFLILSVPDTKCTGDGNNMFELGIYGHKTREKLSFGYRDNTKEGIMKIVKTLLSESCLQEPEGGLIEITIDNRGMRRGVKEFLKHLKSLIEKTVLEIKKFTKEARKKERKWKRTSMNIGIEIEYEGDETPLSFLKEFKDAVVSFNSGFDGLDPDRCRENRLRINGIFGIKALETALKETKKVGCITDGSGLHFHISLNQEQKKAINHCDTAEEQEKMLERVAKLRDFADRDITKDANWEHIKLILDTNTSKREFRINGLDIEFHKQEIAIEYRFFKPTLDYTKMMVQLLFCIHLHKKMIELLNNDCKNASSVSLNAEYIKLLGQIASETINQ